MLLSSLDHISATHVKGSSDKGSVTIAELIRVSLCIDDILLSKWEKQIPQFFVVLYSLESDLLKDGFF